ncbi:disease resistance protein [Tanacetum coccineum]
MKSLKCFHDDDEAVSKDEILFPNLQELHIQECWSLVSLPSNFPKLLSLGITFCPKLRSLPEEIQSFKDLNQITIYRCEILSRRSEDVDTGEIEDNDDDNVNCRDEDTDKNEDKDDDSVIIVAFKVGTLDDISNLVDSMDGILHIGMGDFNAVKSISERAVSQFDANEAMSFSNFIANVRFHDFNGVSKVILTLIELDQR